MTTSEEFQFATMQAERLREQVRQLEADLRSKGDECRHYAEKADRLESERDSWRCISERLEAENQKLRATLDGDPHETASPEQRMAWRRSAIRYADKLEAENKRLREKCDFLAKRSMSAGRIGFAERDYGSSSNYIVAIACGIDADKRLPLDGSDLRACERMWEKMPDSMKSDDAIEAMEAARAALAGTESQFADTSSQVSKDRDEEDT